MNETLTQGTINITIEDTPLVVPDGSHPVFSSFSAYLVFLQVLCLPLRAALTIWALTVFCFGSSLGCFGGLLFGRLNASSSWVAGAYAFACLGSVGLTTLPRSLVVVALLVFLHLFVGNHFRSSMFHPDCSSFSSRQT